MSTTAFSLHSDASPHSIYLNRWKENTAVKLTYDPRHQTQNDSDGDEGPVPVVRSVHCGHAQKDEDKCLADAAPHFQEVLDGGVGLVGYIGLHVGSHHCSTCY